MAKNRYSDSFMSAETPKATNEVWMRIPETKPKAVAKPCLNPLVTLSVKTYKMSGPGEMVKTTEATKNEMVASLNMTKN